MSRVQQVEKQREEQLDRQRVLLRALILADRERAREQPHNRAHGVRAHEGALVGAVVTPQLVQVCADRRVRLLLLLQVVDHLVPEVLGLEGQLAYDLEHLEAELRVRVSRHTQQWDEVLLQHAPRTDRAGRRELHRIVTAQVALQVGDAILAFLADEVLGRRAVGRLVEGAHAREYQQQLSSWTLWNPICLYEKSG